MTRGENSFSLLEQRRKINGRERKEHKEFMSLPPYLRSNSDGVWLAIKLQPRASRNEIGEVMGNELRVKVTAPPVDSAANGELVRFLAERLDCARNQVELVRGHTSRHKTVRVQGMTTEEVVRKIGG